MPKRQYVTTAIDFPNAAPHMGHVYEKILADVMVRWFRLRGDEVRFHVGTDENGIKIQQTAKGLGITPKELVDKNAPMFEELFRKLGVSFDFFIRTSIEAQHWPTVVTLWNKLKEAGALEKRSYSGLYCTGCERFVTEKDLVDGKCPDHNKVPEKVTEENWFFLLTRKTEFLKQLLDPKNGSYRIVPDWRANETVSFLEQGLEDVSFSRSTNTLYWGVPVPDDPDQVMYVWCDNLTSYISSLGYFTDHAMTEWWDKAEVTHVIGKDIARFHALNWPAMLDEAKTKTPDRLLIHGFITSEGQKMSKTLGNVVNPVEVMEMYGVDALRFYLTHEVHVGSDGDFTWKYFDGVYNGVLRNQLGNLLNRVLVMLKKEGGSLIIPAWDYEGKDMAVRWKEYEDSMNTFAFRGTDTMMALVTLGNLQMEQKKPWTLGSEEKLHVLGGLAEMLRHIALMLLPVIPETAQKMSKQLGVPYADEMLEMGFVLSDEMQTWGGVMDWHKVGEPQILFAPLEKKE